MKVKILKRKTFKKVKVSKILVLARASIAQETILDSLIQTSNFCLKQREEMDLALKMGLSEGQAEDMILMLKQNQTDPIACGRNYNMSDIKNKLKWIT